MSKKNLNTNFEVYNYLNIINERLGKFYKFSGIDFLPADFDISQEKFKERLFLNQMQRDDIFPPFQLEEKKKVKKFFKNSLKNVKKMIKTANFDDFSEIFAQKLRLYLNLRLALSQILLKDFHAQDTDEVAVYQEIFNLDPIFGALLDGIYEENFDFKKLESLEENYNASYLEKLKKLEKKSSKKRSAEHALQDSLQLSQKKSKEAKFDEKEAKSLEKSVKNDKKLEENGEIKKIRSQNKKAKQQIKEQ